MKVSEAVTPVIGIEVSSNGFNILSVKINAVGTQRISKAIKCLLDSCDIDELTIKYIINHTDFNFDEIAENGSRVELCVTDEG